MDVLANLGLGFSVIFTPTNLLFCFIGVLLGTLVGVLPGIGPVATIALLLPLTFKMGPASAVIMLAGIYYGAAYGGSTTSILVNIPGEAASVITCLDGYCVFRPNRPPIPEQSGRLNRSKTAGVGAKRRWSFFHSLRFD
jgi:TctA family transporter